MKEPLETLLDTIAQAEDGESAIHTLIRVMESEGFHSVAYMAVDLMRGEPQPRFAASTGPEAWTHRYLDAEYAEIDPILRGAFTRRLPYTWEEVLQPGQMTRRQRTMMNEASDYGMRNGIVVPLPGPGGEYGVVSAAWDPAARTQVRVPPLVHLAAIHANARIWQDLSGPVTPLAGPTRPLTDREIECLKWAANGKTAGEIAEIIGVVPRTAKFHLDNAARKLGVSGRQHAVVKAVMAGIIRG